MSACRTLGVTPVSRMSRFRKTLFTAHPVGFTLALVGDSHAQHWLPVLDEAGLAGVRMDQGLFERGNENVRAAITCQREALVELGAVGMPLVAFGDGGHVPKHVRRGGAQA